MSVSDDYILRES